MTGPCPDGFVRAPRGQAIHVLMPDDCELGAVLTLCSAWYEDAMRVERSARRERFVRLHGDTPFTDFHPAFGGDGPWPADRQTAPLRALARTLRQ